MKLKKAIQIINWYAGKIMNGEFTDLYEPTEQEEEELEEAYSIVKDFLRAMD